MHPYQPRSVTFLGIVGRDDWRLKLYAIALDRAAFDEARFRRGLELALDALPTPSRTTSRPGVGFCIQHQGRGADYVVLAWWDRENELPLRVFVKTPADPEWRPARGGESVCVWDLEVIGFERDAYVRTVLAEPATPPEAYLEAVIAERSRVAT
jgi:hypothetical protein